MAEIIYSNSSNYSVILKDAGPDSDKAGIISWVSDVLSLSEEDAKALVETPDAVIKENTSEADANGLAWALRKRGATVKVVEYGG